jgi:hypothetical protein
MRLTEKSPTNNKKRRRRFTERDHLLSSMSLVKVHSTRTPKCGITSKASRSSDLCPPTTWIKWFFTRPFIPILRLPSSQSTNFSSFLRSSLSFKILRRKGKS